MIEREIDHKSCLWAGMCDSFHGIRDNIAENAVCGYVEDTWLTILIETLTYGNKVSPQEGLSAANRDPERGATKRPKDGLVFIK